MQIQPIIMDSVSQACSKTLSMFLEQTKQNTPVLPPPQATTPLQNSLALDIKKQLRQQAYIKDQIEQDNKSNIIRIKGVTPESADLRQTIINLANDTQVRLHTNDIISCYRTGGDETPAHKRFIVAKLSHRSKKVEIMRNKKNLTGNRYVEEGLTRLRSNLFHTVRMDNNTGRTWTQEGKIMTYVKDNDGEEVRKTIVTPDDLTRIGWTDERICNFWEQFNQ